MVPVEEAEDLNRAGSSGDRSLRVRPQTAQICWVETAHSDLLDGNSTPGEAGWLTDINPAVALSAWTTPRGGGSLS